MSAIQQYIPPTSQFMDAIASRITLSLTSPNEIKPSDDRSRGFLDNFAWQSATSFGRNDRANYYYLQVPSQFDYYRTSRFTEFGHRIVWGVNNDAWNNDFRIEVEGENEEEITDTWNQLEEHFRSIYFFREWKRATGFDREQGESLLFIHRKNTDVNELHAEANINEEVLRLEAINKMDYTIPQQEEFGAASEYRIQFLQKNGLMPTYTSHTSQAIRLRTRDLDYDQYEGQPVLKPCYGSIQILLNITRSAGDAAFRWGTGQIAIFAKGITNKATATAVKTLIGNPTTQSWNLFPSEHIDKIESFGINGSMLDLNSLYDLVLNNIVVETSIPKSILIGDAVGVIEGSRVFERSYYAVLDEIQTSWEPFLHQYLLLDPVVQQILKGRKYNIVWGLRQNMSKTEEAEYKSVIYANAQVLPNCGGTWSEMRQAAELIPWTQVYAEKEELHKQLFGFTSEELSILPASLVFKLIENPKIDSDPQKELPPNIQNQPPLPEETDPFGETPDDPTLPEEEIPEENIPKIEDLHRKMRDSILEYRTHTSLNKLTEALGCGKNTAITILSTQQAKVK